MDKNEQANISDKTLTVSILAFFDTLDECIKDKSKQQVFYQAFIKNIIKRNGYGKHMERVTPFDIQMAQTPQYSGAGN